MLVYKWGPALKGMAQYIRHSIIVALRRVSHIYIHIYGVGGGIFPILSIGQYPFASICVI